MSGSLAPVICMTGCLLLVCICSAVEESKASVIMHAPKNLNDDKATISRGSSGHAARAAHPISTKDQVDQAPPTVVAMTYNVCFGCMTEDPAVRAADGSDLAQECATRGCLQNVATLIDSINADLLFVQEASNFAGLRARSSALSQMSVFHTQSGQECMATFVSSRFAIKHRVSGSLSQTNKGRPFLILIGKDTRTKRDVVLVNLHRSHNKAHGKGYMASRFSAAVNAIPNVSVLDPVVVCGGDFNDEGLNLWKGDWSPFKGCKSIELASVVVKSTAPPPASCCDQDHATKPFHKGKGKGKGAMDVCDFVLSNCPFTRHNHVAAVNPWTSDHLPVACTLDVSR